MRAFVCNTISEDLSGASLTEIAEPVAKAGEVKIAVRAASLNFPDILMCQGKYQFKPELPFTVGMEFAGDVVETGEGVTRWKIGDRVCGGAKTGAFAEFVTASEDGLRPVPAAYSYAEGAAFGAAYLTAYVSLVRRARIEAGETLLVHGASGGVGMATIEVGKLLGATVIATTGRDSKMDAIRQAGADHVLNLRDGFREQVKELTDGRGADVIFDPIGGDVFDESTRCIAFDGRLLVIGFMSGRIAEIKTNIPLIKGFSVVGVRAGEYGRRFPEKGRENMAQVQAWAEDGLIRPRIHAELSLDEAAKGLGMLTGRDVIGKIVLTA